MKTNVTELDGYVRFIRAQAARLDELAKNRGVRWAEADAEKMRKIAEALLEVRRDLQMTTMSGKSLEERPDRDALIACPELQGKKALVCYFATDADRDQFAAQLLAMVPNARSERIP